MEDEKDKGKFIHRLKYNYRLVILNDKSFKEVLSIRLTKLNAYLIVGSSALLLVAIVTLLIAFTPLRELIPGYPSGETRRHIIRNAYLLDSLENELHKRDRYFKNINAIITGKEPTSYNTGVDTSFQTDEIEFTKSIQDSLLRIQVEQEEQYNLALLNKNFEEVNISKIHFFPPVKGMVTSSFDAKANHYGTDIAVGTDNIVKATLGGTVIMSTWSLKTGYVIQIQHKNNLISVYKHNAELLKEEGAIVKAGEAIAVVGNSGELLTTGPHLHFELWQNGIALDAENYIVF
jgi:murein DD-endopeptidase MepM/ murein hydrolase activator NlpD